MTPARAFIVVVIFAMAASDTASADTVVVSQATALRAYPGEMGRVVARVKRGQSARLVRTKGRWYRVKVGKHTGWLTRTTVRRSRRVKRNRARRWGRRTSKSYGAWRNKAMVSGRDKTLPKKLVVDLNRVRALRKPNARARVVFSVGSGAELHVLARSRRGRWYLVQSDDSAPGWVPAAAVRKPNDVRAKTTARSPERISAGISNADAPTPVTAVKPPVPIDGLRLGVGVGIHNLTTQFHSNGTTGLGNYDLSTSAANVGVDGSFHRSSGRLALAVLGTYRGTYAAPGLRYQPSAGGEGDIALTSHSVEATVAVGGRISAAAGGIGVYASAGYHYDVTLTDSLDNIAGLPNESVSGALLGGRLEVGRIAEDMSARVSVHTLFGGKLGQSQGLMDGERSDLSATYVRVGLTKRLSSEWLLLADYYHARAKLSFSGASSRQPDVSQATRSDTAHTLTIGLGRRL